MDELWSDEEREVLKEILDTIEILVGQPIDKSGDELDQLARKSQCTSYSYSCQLLLYSTTDHRISSGAGIYE